MGDYARAHERFHAAGFEPEEGLIRVHHEITRHLVKAECDWSGYVVEMDRERVDLSKADHLPMHLVAAVRQAQGDGVTVGDLVTMLTSEGWEVRLVPAGSTVGDALPVAGTVESAAPEAISEGVFVSWNTSGGRARGRVEHVMTEGTLGVPGSSFSIDASPDDPAVLIRIWRPREDTWAETETLVGHRASTLTVIGDLSKRTTKREDGEDFPQEAFAYVPDPERPSTWKLRLWDSLDERETRAQVSRAVQALSPAGFRGNRVDIPAEDVAGVKARVRAAWNRVNPDREVPPILKQESFEPPLAVQEAAQRALRWIDDGKAGSGFTAVGRARAAQLARGAAVSRETIGRMRSFFARHEVNSEVEGWNMGEAGFPTPGRVAWDAWGGNAGQEWANMIWDRMENAEDYYAPKDHLSTRQAMMYSKYKWIADIVGPWDASAGPDGAHYIPAADNPFSGEGLNCASCVFFRGGGGCKVLSSPVEPGGLCKLWIIPEEPAAPAEPEDVLSLGKASGDVRKAEEHRFTLGPWYVPDTVDAHGEFTDAEELQAALWRYVRSGDRRIRLQHNVDVIAGEAVEMMTWPYPVTLPLGMPDGSVSERTFPANTVFLGVVWEPWAWEYVKAGRISGYSIGGRTDRVMVDLPE